jgi:hypothetical protein
MSYVLFDTVDNKDPGEWHGRAPQYYDNFVTDVASRYSDWEDIPRLRATRIIDSELELWRAWTEDTLDHNGFIQDFRLVFPDQEHAVAFLLRWA